MFSGNTGAVVVSGGGLATSTPTYELARDARKVVRDLPAGPPFMTGTPSRARAGSSASLARRAC